MDNKIYEEFTPISSHICNRLFTIGENSFGTRRIVRFYKLLRRYPDSERMFSLFRAPLNTKNDEVKVDNLVRSVKKRPIFIVHMDLELSD